MTTVVNKIVFENNPLKVCYSGQLFKGVATICFTVPVYVEDICLKFVGEGFYRWVDEISGNEKTGSVQYFNGRKDLLRTSDDVVLSGLHEYPFEIQLPTHLPTSYEGTYGHIRYTMLLYIGSGQTIEPFLETFTVIKPLNLNSGNAYRMPMEVLKFARFTRSFFGCNLWTSEDLKIYGRLPVSGYCSGQIINLTLDVINHSGQDIRMFVVRFVKEVSYNSSDGLKKIEKMTLVEQKAKGLPGNKTDIQTVKINVSVPSLPPTGFQSVNYVCVLNYMLRVTAITKFRNQDPMLEIPVIVGTYPISNEPPQFTIDSAISVLPEPIFTSLERGVNTIPPYPDTDPPSYEDSVRNGSSIERTKFTPKYPVYRRETSYSVEHFE